MIYTYSLGFGFFRIVDKNCGLKLNKLIILPQKDLRIFSLHEFYEILGWNLFPKNDEFFKASKIRYLKEIELILFKFLEMLSFSGSLLFISIMC